MITLVIAVLGILLIVRILIMVRIICGYLFVVSAKLAHIQTKVNKLCVGTVPTAGTNPKLLPLPAKTAPPAGTKTNKHSLAAPSA
tara:strand:+ start:245 stop:499 length:255 start_codon:yes stop_codon:yes gene_type:complete